MIPKFSFPEKLSCDGVSIVSGKAIDDINRREIHAAAVNFIRARVEWEGNRAVLVPPEICSFWLVDFDSPGDRGDALFLSVASGCKAWVEILVRINPALTYSVALGDLERTLQAEYRAFVAALLPRYRQLVLDGQFDLVSDGFCPGQFFSPGNIGEESFFHLSTRLIVRDWLVRKGLRIPLVMYCSQGFGGDWGLAVWRMMIGSLGQTIVISSVSPRETLESIFEILRYVDWRTSDIPVFDFPMPQDQKLNFSFPLATFFQGDIEPTSIDSLLY